MKNADEIYKEIYDGNIYPITGYTLDEIRLRPVYSEVLPHDVDVSVKLGKVKMNIPLLSAAMDTVTAEKMAQAMFEVGGCGIIYRHKRPEVQFEWIEKTLAHKPCLVSDPMTLSPEHVLDDAKDILENYGYSTIPIVDNKKILLGILFTKDVAFSGREDDSVQKWMIPFNQLKVESNSTPFEKIQERLLNENDCTLLPVVNDQKCLQGVYFMKDMLNIQPVYYNDKPLVGMAIGVNNDDIERAKEGIKAGVGMIVIDSSHGSCPSVIDQAKRIVSISNKQANVIAGNITDIDGYLKLAEVGVDAVKIGIGCGATCTTSTVTGVGMPLFTLLRELSYTRNLLKKAGKNAPVIIPDGGMDSTGNMVVALAAGGHACMSGVMFVSATESISYQKNGSFDGYVAYRGMASKGAILSRSSDRYGKQKKAPEGEEGMVEFRGPVKTWIGGTVEWIKGGFSHVGAKNLADLHEIGEKGMSFVRFTGFGKDQINVRMKRD